MNDLNDTTVDVRFHFKGDINTDVASLSFTFVSISDFWERWRQSSQRSKPAYMVCKSGTDDLEFLIIPIDNIAYIELDD